MSGPLYLLDARTVMAALRGDPGVDARLLALEPQHWCVSAITQAIVEAALRDQRASFGMQATAVAFFDMAHVVPWDAAAARMFALMERPALHVNDPDIDVTDHFVAAHALALQAVLVTPLQDRFDMIPGLSTEDWIAPFESQ